MIAILHRKLATRRTKLVLRKRMRSKQRLARRRASGKRRAHGGADLAYNQGYDAGYDAALAKARQAGAEMQDSLQAAEAALKQEDEYRRGLYDGGEAHVDTMLTDLEFLPEHSIRDIIAAGVAALRPQMQHLLDTGHIAGRIREAMERQQPLSIVRLGDGELLTLAQDVVLSPERAAREGHFLSYAGVDLPDMDARDMLAQSIRQASIVGVPTKRMPNFQPLALAAFKAHGMDYRQMQLTASTINYSLYQAGQLASLLDGRRILLVGNTAPALGGLLADKGFQVIGVIAPVDGIHDTGRVLGRIRENSDFEIALVSAGIAAVVLCQRIATELGKVALDFGHLSNALLKGEAAL